MYLKKYHYVGIVTDNNELRFVTTIDNARQYAEWKKGEKPLVFTKSQAEQISAGLMFNGYNAFIACFYRKLTGQFVPDESEEFDNE